MFRRVLAFVIGIMVCINLLWVPPALGASDNSIMRVKLLSLGTPSSIDIVVDGTYGVPKIDKNNILNKGTYTVRVQSGQLVLDDKTGSKTQSTALGSSFTFKRYQDSGTNRLKIGNKYYLGDMEVRISNGTIELINHVHIETYLYGVVPYEMSDSWPLEALKAQAVAARTYAIRNKKTTGYYDIVDTTLDQVYNGYNSTNKNSIKAVNETFGKVLKYGSKYADTFYSASNGGKIEAAENLWGGKVPYSVVKDDPYDINNPNNSHRSWTKAYDKKSVDSQLLKRLGFKDKLKEKGLSESDVENIEINNLEFKYNDSGRASEGTIVLSMNKKQDPDNKINISITLSKSNIRTVFDLKSLLFDVVDKTDAFVFEGKGYGHGIGMSQYGAYQMAREGFTYDQILAFYYEGTSLSDLNIEPDKGGDPKPSNPSTNPEPEPEPKPDPKPDPGKEQQFGRVNVSTSLNVRSGPGTNYKRIASLKKGDRVEILDRSGAWYKIKTGSIQGYVHGDYIVLETKEQPTPPSSGNDQKPGTTDPAPPPSDDRRYGIVTASALNVRSGPSTKNHKVGMVVKGTRLTILATQGVWYKISYNGKTAYVHSDYVKLESTSTPSTGSGNVGTVIGKATVTASSLNVRSGAGTNYKRIGSLPRNRQVELLAKQGAWYKIKYGSGVGYVHGDYLKIISSGNTGNNNSSNNSGSQNSGTEQRTGTVNASALNVRSGPGTNYSRKGTLSRGTKVTITGESGSWYKIKYGSGTGYVHKNYITITSGSNSRATEQRTGTVNASALNVRSGPGTNYSRVGLLSRGAKVTITGESGSWYKIKSGSLTGYVSKQYIK